MKSISLSLAKQKTPLAKRLFSVMNQYNVKSYHIFYDMDLRFMKHVYIFFFILICTTIHLKSKILENGPHIRQVISVIKLFQRIYIYIYIYMYVCMYVLVHSPVAFAYTNDFTIYINIYIYIYIYIYRERERERLLNQLV